MKKTFLVLSLVAATLLVGCNSEPSPEPQDGAGYVSVECSASPEVTRAEAFTVPTADEFSLCIEGENYSKEWAKLTDFVSKENLLKVGDYTATVEWGDASVEGVNKPAYAGQTNFTILSMRTVEASVTARLINSQFTVNFTENFLNYFHDEEFVMTSSLGNEFTFSSSVSDVVFVAAGELKIQGKALKQNGVEVLFPAQSITAEARKVHTLSFDMTGAGTAQVVIKLDDTVIDTQTIDTELNPES